MKKLLLGTSAIACVALAGAANAQDPIQLSISGNLQTALTVHGIGGDNTSAYTGGNITTNDDSLGIQQDWDLVFTGSTTLENGLTLGVYMNLDTANNTNAKEDEVYAIISGGFGEFRIGQDDSAATDVGGSYRPNGGSSFVVGDGTYDVTLDPAASLLSTDPTLAGNSATIWYRTPSFAGFQVTATYTPDAVSVRPQTKQRDGSLEDVFGIAGEYSNSFGAIDLGVATALEFGNGDNGAGDALGWLAGATVGVAGFTFGGGYRQNYVASAGTSGAAHLGVSYSIDKVGVGIHGAYGFNDVGAETDRGWGITVDGSYALGPGITFGAAVGYSMHDYGTVTRGTGTAAVPGGSIEGVGVGTDLVISF